MGATRCPDCNKFPALETQDPDEQQEPTVDEQIVTASYRIERNCAECGTTIKATEIELEAQIELADGSAKDCPNTDTKEHAWEIDGDVTVEGTESGGGRYAKNLIGVSMEGIVKCSCGANGNFFTEDSTPASAFDEEV